MPHFFPNLSEDILHNPGCGILYLQRGLHKARIEEVDAESWFFKERLTDKIAFSLPWSVLEPEEGRYQWEHPDWEACITSWVQRGYRVALQIRGMDTLGTFYDQGVPQWVFDAGARYVDESISNYRGSFLLNDIPKDTDAPVRYPVYWDPIYLEKVEQLVDAMGARYDGRPEVEFIGIGHMGRWGEMHIAGHGPLQPWLKAGLTLDAYLQAHKRIVEAYRRAFPRTALSQEVGAPAFGEGNAPSLFPLETAEPLFECLAQMGVHLKYNGLGKGWAAGTPYLDEAVHALMHRHRDSTKVCFENLVLPEALEEGLNCGISYWHPGGESPGLGIRRIEEPVPIPQKRIFSFYPFFPAQYDALTIEDQKQIWRTMARQCGYRLEPRSLSLPDRICPGARFPTEIHWCNSGRAHCHETWAVRLSLAGSDGKVLWSQRQPPAVGVGAKIWKAGTQSIDRQVWDLPAGIPPSVYELWLGLEHEGAKGPTAMELPLGGARSGGNYFMGNVRVSAP